MDCKRSLCWLGAALLAGALEAALLSRPMWTISAETPKAEPALAAGDKWEYCAVSKAAYIASPRAGVYWITYFQPGGFKVVDVEDNATSNAALAKAIAKLGDEGWELVHQGTLEVRGNKLDAWYFKRPKQQQ